MVPRANEKKSYPFRFERLWLTHEDVEAVVQDAWQSASTAQNFMEQSLKIKQLSEKHGTLQKAPPTLANLTELKRVETELDDLLKQEEIMWTQRSRVLWMNEGDKNTNFFHRKASNQRQRNKIERIRDEGGRWFEGEIEVEQCLVNYYSKLFRSVPPTDIQVVLDTVDTRVTPEMNAQHTQEEVYKALRQMHPSKAPGPDGDK